MSTRPSPLQLVVGGAGVVLVLSLFLSWYSFDLGALDLGPQADGAQSVLSTFGGLDTTATAWQAFTWVDLIACLAGLSAIAWVVLDLRNLAAASPVPLPTVIGVLSLISTILIAYRIINQPGPNDLLKVEIGAYVGLIASAALLFLSWPAVRSLRSRVA